MTPKRKNNKPGNVMSPHAHHKNLADDEVALQIFEIIEQNPKVSEKKITMQTGLAAGLVHSFMKRVIAKGWIRARQVNTKRWLYFLTPEGFIAKSRLSMNYLSRTFNTYRMAQDIVQEQIRNCAKNNWRRLIIAGKNDLAEITALNVRATSGFVLAAVMAEKSEGETLADYKVLPFDHLKNINYDKILVCDVSFNEWRNNGNADINSGDLLPLIDSFFVTRA